MARFGCISGSWRRTSRPRGSRVWFVTNFCRSLPSCPADPLRRAAPGRRCIQPSPSRPDGLAQISLFGGLYSESGHSRYPHVVSGGPDPRLCRQNKTLSGRFGARRQRGPGHDWRRTALSGDIVSYHWSCATVSESAVNTEGARSVGHCWTYTLFVSTLGFDPLQHACRGSEQRVCSGPWKLLGVCERHGVALFSSLNQLFRKVPQRPYRMLIAQVADNLPSAREIAQDASRDRAEFEDERIHGVSGPAWFSMVRMAVRAAPPSFRPACCSANCART